MTTTTAKTTTPASKPTTARATATKTTPAKPTTKPATPAKAAAATAAKSTTPLPKVVKVSEPVVSAPDMKKKELVDLVVERSGIKKKDAKPVAEAMLAILGETLADGRELNLPPLGKVRINRTEDKVGYRVIVCKLRQSTRPPTPSVPKDPLAEPGE